MALSSLYKDRNKNKRGRRLVGKVGAATNSVAVFEIVRRLALTKLQVRRFRKVKL